MFDLTSGKLLLLGIVALIVLGPKDFPILLRTIGKYMGIIKRQADEFRAQFDEAIRESEFDQLKKDVEGLGQDLNESMRDTERSISKDFDELKSGLDVKLDDPLKSEPHTTGYTPEGLQEPTAAGERAALPEPTDKATADPDAHDANGIPMPGGGEATPERAPAVTQGERAGMNGSGGHADHAAVAEISPKSGT